MCFFILACDICELEIATTVQARLQLQLLLHNKQCSESTALPKLMLNYLSSARYKVYGTVHVPAENACLDTLRNCSDIGVTCLVWENQ